MSWMHQDMGSPAYAGLPIFIAYGIRISSVSVITRIYCEYIYSIKCMYRVITILSMIIFLSVLCACSCGPGPVIAKTLSSAIITHEAAVTPVVVSPLSDIPPPAAVEVFQDMPAVAKPDTAVIIFTFDDGPVSDYTLAFPILKKYGIKGTSYIIPKYMDKKTRGKIKWAQVREMYGYGWVFGCHTWDHRAMAGLSTAQIKKSMEKVDRSFIRQGLPPPRILAYPYGSYNKRVIRAIKPYRKQARLAYYSTRFVYPGKGSPYKIPSISADMRSSSQLKRVKKLVDKACRKKAVIVFRVHTLYRKRPYDTVRINKHIRSGCPPQTSSVLFEKLVAYCKEKGCTFMTMLDLMDLYS